jgi:hypothetical protein
MLQRPLNADFPAEPFDHLRIRSVLLRELLYSERKAVLLARAMEDDSEAARADSLPEGEFRHGTSVPREPDTVNSQRRGYRWSSSWDMAASASSATTFSS